MKINSSITAPTPINKSQRVLAVLAVGAEFPSGIDPALHISKFNLIFLGQTQLCGKSVKSNYNKLYYKGGKLFEQVRGG